MSEKGVLIEFSKVWGQYDYRWNYPGGGWNFKTMSGFIDFYGIVEIKSEGFDFYEIDGKLFDCIQYQGLATKNIDLIRKHYVSE